MPLLNGWRTTGSQYQEEKQERCFTACLASAAGIQSAITCLRSDCKPSSVSTNVRGVLRNNLRTCCITMGDSGLVVLVILIKYDREAVAARTSTAKLACVPCNVTFRAPVRPPCPQSTVCSDFLTLPGIPSYHQIAGVQVVPASQEKLLREPLRWVIDCIKVHRETCQQLVASASLLQY